MRIPDLIERAVSTLFPPVCVLCGAPGHEGRDLCAGCWADLPHNRPCCQRCALPLDTGAGEICGACLHSPPPFAVCHAPFRYEDPIAALVSGAKFHGRLNLARMLGESLGVFLAEREADRPGVIIPMPLHPGRLRQRGYNQALELARPVSRALRIPIDARCCTRTRATAPQVGLEMGARRRNVRGAFQVLRPPAADHVAVLDDVVTTGSTVAELTRALLRAGVARVEVWAVARTP